jgi:two-component system, OmpR family, sensor histidine kinase VicK
MEIIMIILSLLVINNSSIDMKTLKGLTNTYLMDSMPTTAEDVEEKTEVIYGAKDIVNDTIERLYAATEYVDNCIDSTAPSMFVIPNHPVTKAFRDLRQKGIRLRFITEITKDNIEYCKELTKMCNLRHLDEVKGNFGIVDGIYYRANARTTKSSPPPLLIRSALRAFVEQQQYFFDMLWKKAIPAKQRIKEIEEGTKREFIETIQDPSETLDLIRKTISSATEEIMIMFPTIRSFQVYEREGVLDLIKRQLENRITVRILLAEKDRPPQRAWQEISSFPNLHIQYTDQLSSSRLTMVIIDNELSLVIEEKKYEDPVGIATYSNSESTVLSYASIFENLWIQSEMKQQ